MRMMSFPPEKRMMSFPPEKLPKVGMITRSSTEPDDVVRRDGNRLVIGNPNAVTYIDAGRLRTQIEAAMLHGQETKKICIAGEVRLSGDASHLFTATAVPTHDYNTPSNRVRFVEEIEGLQRLDTRNVTNMEGMFNGMLSLKSVEGIENWDTHNVRSMRSMFAKCKSLPSVDISSFDTSNVTDMSTMFYGCYSMKSLDMSHFDMPKVVDVSGMCKYCPQLENASIAGWNAPRLQSMDYMFASCELLKELDTTGVSIDSDSMTAMFDRCRSIEELDLSGITGTIHDSSFAFHQCSSLRTIDLSNLDAKLNAGTVYMFADCDSLKTAKLTETMRKELSRRESLPEAARVTRTPIAVELDDFGDDKTVGMPYQLG